jgi:phenylacetate-CoA ligase
MEQIFADHGLDLRGELAAAGLAETLWQLPFVYVYERSDFSVSFFAFQVYPETVRNALAQGAFPEQLTGKFTMTAGYDAEGQQELTIHLEFKPGTSETPELSEQVRAAVVTKLLQENSEYRRTHEEYGERVHPKLVFWPYEDLMYFRPGTKQKWVQK